MYIYHPPTSLPHQGDLTNFQGSATGSFATALHVAQEAVRDELPAINTEIELRGHDPGELLAFATPILSDLAATIPAQLEMWVARSVLMVVAMIISSAERHFQARGHIPGIGKSLVPYGDELLAILGPWVQKTPRDTTFEYWHWNRGARPNRFMGDIYEDVFRAAVNRTYDLQASSAEAIRHIAAGEVDSLSLSAADAYTFAAENTTKLCTIYRALTEKMPDGQWRMPQDFFANRYRQYLARYPVAGIMYSGVNAANVGPGLSMDFLLGFAAPWYRAVAEQSFLYQTDEDRRVLQQDMQIGSVVKGIYNVIGYKPTAVADPAEKRWVALAIAKQPGHASIALSAFAKLIQEARRLTAIHFSQISAYLIKPGTIATHSGGDGGPKLPVPAASGTGGRSHDETKAIMQMRRQNASIDLLLTSADQLGMARSA